MCKMKFQICKKSSSNQLTWWLSSGSVEFNKLANYRNMKKKSQRKTQRKRARERMSKVATRRVPSAPTNPTTNDGRKQEDEEKWNLKSDFHFFFFLQFSCVFVSWFVELFFLFFSLGSMEKLIYTRHDRWTSFTVNLLSRDSQYFDKLPFIRARSEY